LTGGVGAAAAASTGRDNEDTASLTSSDASATAAVQ